MRGGLREIPIEERGSEEVQFADGLLIGPGGKTGRHAEVLVAPPDSPAANYGFDVTPARLITGLITERGRCRANERAILALFPEYARLARARNRTRERRKHT